MLEQPWPAAMANLGFIWVATLAYIFGARSAARLGAAALIGFVDYRLLILAAAAGCLLSIMPMASRRRAGTARTPSA